MVAAGGVEVAVAVVAVVAAAERGEPGARWWCTDSANTELDGMGGGHGGTAVVGGGRSGLGLPPSSCRSLSRTEIGWGTPLWIDEGRAIVEPRDFEEPPGTVMEADRPNTRWR